MPPRQCIIKHKIQGGMLPLATVSIEPAFQVLGMSPQEYTEYLASLPFGQKYLIERAALSLLPAAHPQTATPPSTQVQEETPAKAPPPEIKPLLDEQEQAFLAYVIANPETPLTAVYKGIEVSVRRGNDIPDSLKAQGYIAEIETRLGTGGRRTHFFIPTFTTFDLLRKEPPPGRGGAIHRHIQQLIEMGAAANGFTAKCEYDIGNGGIVDVHLERGDIRIAVEIAVASRPSREIAHIKNCLAVGYARVYDVFAEERMQQKTQEALAGEFSEAEREKIQLLHLSKLSELVYSMASLAGGKVVLPAELLQGE
jgi:hypothetical protein